MKEHLLDVLIYLFDHCLESDSFEQADQETLIGELEEAGFCEKQISKAFDWLDGIHSIENLPTDKGSLTNFRVYTTDENKKINLECQGLLWNLQQWEILDTMTREIIIDRAMALDMGEIHIDHFKWVTLMVLINRGAEQSLEWLEEIVFSDYSEVMQ